MEKQRSFAPWLFCLIVCHLVVSFWLLVRYPLVQIDEPWLAQAAWSLAHGSGISLPMFAGSFSRDVVWYTIPVMHLVLAPIVGVFGVGVVQARLGSVLMGALAVVLASLLGKELAGRKVGLIAGLCLIANPLFFVMNRTVRNDIYVVPFSLLALLLYVRWRPSITDRRFAVIGLCAGIATMAHLYGGFVLVAILLADAYSSRSVRRTIVRTLWSLAGVLVVLGIVALWASQDWDVFVAQWTRGSVTGKMPGLGLASILDCVLSEPQRYANLPGWFITAPAMLLGLLGLLRSRATRLVGFVMLAQVLLFALLVSSKYSGYFVVLTPLASIGLARLLTTDNGTRNGVAGKEERPSLGRWRLHRAIGIVAVSLVIVGAAGSIATAYGSRDADYYGFCGRVSALIPEGAVVCGLPTYWFGMMDYDYRAIHAFARPEELREAGVEYLLVSDWFLRALDTPGRSWNAHRTDWLTLVEDRGLLVGEVEDLYYAGSLSPGDEAALMSVYRLEP